MPVLATPSLKFCRECGAQLIEGTKYCRECGAPAQVSSAAAGAPAQTQTYAQSAASAVQTVQSFASGAKQVASVAQQLVGSIVNEVEASATAGEMVLSTWQGV